MPRLEEEESLNYNSKSTVAILQTFLSTDPLPKNLSCLFLGLRGHLTQLTVPLAETLSERLGICAVFCCT